MALGHYAAGVLTGASLLACGHTQPAPPHIADSDALDAGVPSPSSDPLTPLDGIGVVVLSVGLLATGLYFDVQAGTDCSDPLPEFDYGNPGCRTSKVSFIGAGIGLLAGPILYDLGTDGAGSLLYSYSGLLLGAAPGLLAEAYGWAVLGGVLGAGIGYAWNHADVGGFTPTINVQRTPDGGRRYTASVGFSF